MWNKIIMKQDRFVGNFVFDLSKWTTRYINFFLKILKSDGYGQLKLNKKKVFVFVSKSCYK